jgi:hypothetical protein
MIAKRIAAAVLFLLMVASLPLCCLSTMALVPNFLFRGEFDIVNETGETLYVTPLGRAYGERIVLLELFSTFPYLGLFKRADIRVKPGEAIHVVCEIDEDLIFSEIVVRNEAGEVRQLEIDDPTIRLIPRAGEGAKGTGPAYAIETFAGLRPPSPAAMEAVEKARQFDAAGWLELSLGLVPLGLLAVWLRTVRNLWTASRKKG